MEATRPRYTRLRRQWDVMIEHLQPWEVAKIQTFVAKKALAGANAFTYRDLRDPKNPETYTVRFSTLPEFEDDGWVENELRQNVKFQLREV